MLVPRNDEREVQSWVHYGHFYSLLQAEDNRILHMEERMRD